MESRIKCVLLKPCMAALSCAALSFSGLVLAEAVNNGGVTIPPDIKPRTVKEANIDSENFEIGIFGGLLSVEDFGSNAVYGVRGTYHLSEDLFFEASYGLSDTQETSYERLSGSARLLTDDQRELSYYSVDVGYRIFPGESFVGKNYAFNSSFAFLLGMGSTEFGGDSRLTVNFGATYQILLTDWLALNISGRDHIFDIDLLGEEKTTHNLEFSSGLSVFF